MDGIHEISNPQSVKNFFTKSTVVSRTWLQGVRQLYICMYVCMYVAMGLALPPSSSGCLSPIFSIQPSDSLSVCSVPFHPRFPLSTSVPLLLFCQYPLHNLLDHLLFASPQSRPYSINFVVSRTRVLQKYFLQLRDLGVPSITLSLFDFEIPVWPDCLPIVSAIVQLHLYLQ